MPVPVRDAQMQFDGGLNTVSDDIALQPNQVRRADNARLTEYGALVKRRGSVKFGTNATLHGNIGGGFCWNRVTGAVEGLAVIDGVLHTADMTNPPGTTAWTPQPGTLSTATPPSFAQFVTALLPDVVFIADNSFLNYWDGTALTELIPSPKVTAIKVHNERLWGVGNVAKPTSLYYSALNKGETLGDGANGGGEIIVRTYGSDALVGLASVGSSLLIFHTRGISRLTGFGQDDIAVQPEGVSTQTGTIAPESIVEVDGGVFFVSDRGAFFATESQVVPLGTPTSPDPILPVLRTMFAAEVIRNIRGVLSRRTQEVWFALPGVGTYIYHTILRAWSGPWLGEYAQVTCFWSSAVDGSGEQYVMCGSASTAPLPVSGAITVADVDTYHTDRATAGSPNGGLPIEMVVQLRRLYFGDDSIAKTFRFGYLTAALAAAADIIVSWRSDLTAAYGPSTIRSTTGGVWGAVGATWGTGTYDARSGSQNYRVQLAGTGYFIDVTLRHTAFNEPTISRWQMDAYALGRR